MATLEEGWQNSLPTGRNEQQHEKQKDWHPSNQGEKKEGDGVRYNELEMKQLLSASTTSVSSVSSVSVAIPVTPNGSQEAAKPPEKKETSTQPKLILEAVDGLRFIAAIYVFWGHHGIAMVEDMNVLPFSHLQARGDVGVNLFFLLAGMILYVVYRRTSFKEQYSIWNFYVARFSRIYPSYLISLVISFQLLYVNVRDYMTPLDSTVSIIYNLFCIQSWTPWTAYSWNVVSWTISTFMFFWAIYPWIHRFVQNLESLRAHVITLGVCYFLACLPFALYVIAAGGESDEFIYLNESKFDAWYIFLRTFPPLRIPLFLLGMIAAKLVIVTNMKQKTEWYYQLIGDVSFVLLVIIVAAVPFAPNHKGSTHNGNPHRVGWDVMMDVLLSPIVLCMLVGLAIEKGCLAWFCKLKYIVIIGRWSFSIYIYSAGVFSLSTLFRKNNADKAIGPYALFYIELLIALIVAGFMHKYAEEPMRKILLLKLTRKKKEIPPNKVITTRKNTIS